MGGEVDLRQLDHLLQGRLRRRQQDVVVAVPVDSGVDIVDIAAVAAILEDVEEFITIETVGKPGQDLALADAIADSEAGRDFSTKSDVGELLDVHVDNESEEDGAELERHLMEEHGEPTNIKGLTLVHRTSKDLGSVSDEVADRLDDGPGANIGGDTGLVGELEIMEPKSITKETDHDPVKLFEHKRSYAYTPIILINVDASKLVFYNWY